jgi:hypothetical protein
VCVRVHVRVALDTRYNILLLTDSVEEFIEAIGHNHMHPNEVINGSEAARREIPLSALQLLN